MINAKIIGTGSYKPIRRLTNEDLEQMVDTTDEWIMERTGIKERPIAELLETPSVLATNAAKKAITNSKIDANEIDLIIAATVKGDFHFPSCACQVQKNLGLDTGYAYDLNAGCTGFIYALDQADSAIKTGKIETALIVGVEKLSDVTDYNNRKTCILFGDAAGAVIVRKTQEQRGIMSSYLKADGRYLELLWCSNEADGRHLLKMDGNAVFRKAVRFMLEAAEKCIAKAGIDQSDIDLIIPHQANIKIMTAMAKRLNLEDKVVLNIKYMGNISSATIPITLDELSRKRKLKKDALILLDAFGAGFTWGAILLKW